MSASNKWSFKVSSFIVGEDFWRGIVAIIVFLIFWEIGSRSEALFGFAFPWVGQVPAPSAVLKEIYRLIRSQASGTADI
jgi:NitT/TauT family transport system permease protein